MTRLTAMLIALALWAGIFLPGLGSIEFQGEEGRRVMPAVAMMEGGSWAVPHVGGKPFLRKPPLVQWCMAGTMSVFGKNAWAARLPSALAVLALAAVIVLATRGWLITEQALVAALVFMSLVSTVDKARFAELETVYVALSGIAVVLWMSWRAQGRSPWLVWMVPALFNGLAVLAKAPLHLLFFYVLAIAVMRAGRGEKESRREWPAVLAGVFITLAVVAAWAVPHFREVAAGEAASVWKAQFFGRVSDSNVKVDWGRYAMNLPSGLADLLPWVLFAPLLWSASATAAMHPREAAIFKGTRLAVVACFLGMLLVPGVLPRYVQPLAVPFSLLLAPVLWDLPRRFRHWWRYSVFGLTFVVFLVALAGPFLVALSRTRGPVWPAALALVAVIGGALCLMQLRRRLAETMHLALWTALIAVMAKILFAAVAVPFVREKDDIRPFAEVIDGELDGEELIAFSADDYAPLLAVVFYMDGPVRYAPEASAAPRGLRAYLVRGKDRKKFEREFRVTEDPIAYREAKGSEPQDVVLRAERR